MNDLVFTSLVLIVGGLVHGAVLKRHEPKEGRLLTFGFVAHVGSGFAQILLYRFYYGGGDMTAYFDFGVPIAEALRDDFAPLFPLTVEVFFHGSSRLPFEMLGGGSTGTMLMVAVWLLFLLGNSLVAATVSVSIASYLSKVLIYRVLRDHFEEDHRPTVLLASLLVPSAVFWTSSLLKEPVMMVFLGPIFLALRWILEGRRLWQAAVLAIGGGIGVWLLKPYVLVSFAAAAGVWVIWQRVLKQRGQIVVKPIYLFAGLTLSVGAFTAADRYLPKSESQSVMEAMAAQRRSSAMEEGGSNFYLEDPTQVGRAESRVSLASQLALAPLALVTAYFRPFIFEARNSVQAANALETTWILVLFVQVLRRNKWTELVLRVMNRPALLFSFSFSLMMALGTGLSTANLGTLSRYRAPMMPFAVLLLLTLRKTEVARTRVVQLSDPESEAVRD